MPGKKRGRAPKGGLVDVLRGAAEKMFQGLMLPQYSSPRQGKLSRWRVNSVLLTGKAPPHLQCVSRYPDSALICTSHVEAHDAAT